MTITGPDARSGAPGQAVVDAAMLVLERMGLTPADLLAAPAARPRPVRDQDRDVPRPAWVVRAGQRLSRADTANMSPAKKAAAQTSGGETPHPQARRSQHSPQHAIHDLHHVAYTSF